MAFATHNPIFELCMNFYIKSLTSYRNDVTIFSSDNRGEFMKNIKGNFKNCLSVIDFSKYETLTEVQKDL